MFINEILLALAFGAYRVEKKKTTTTLIRIMCKAVTQTRVCINLVKSKSQNQPAFRKWIHIQKPCGLQYFSFQLKMLKKKKKCCLTSCIARLAHALVRCSLRLPENKLWAWTTVNIYWGKGLSAHSLQRQL